MKLQLKKLDKSDMEAIWQAGYRKDNPEWTKWNAPYFDEYKAFPELSQFVNSKICQFLMGPNCMGIFVDNLAIGMVSYHWEDKVTRWMEVGIVIYNSDYWHSGYGSQALSLWMRKLFELHSEIEHLGLTTWSGNVRMMRTAEKLGMKKEAEIRKVRYWQGHYFDSVKYGILREESML